MEYKKNCDTLYEKDSLNEAKQTVSPNNQALKAEGRYSDDCYSNIQKAENNGTQYALDNDDKSGPGPTQWCTWKVTAVVFIALTALLLVTVFIIGGIWLRESDVLAVSQKTSMERNKQRQQEEELKRKEREREIRAEEEKKRLEREQEIRVEEEQKKMELEKEIRQEEEEKREALERLLGERERRLAEVRAQCNSGQMVSSCSTGLSVLLSVLLVNYLLDY
ncbi:inner centromere protein-like isoform X2 [Alosa sapidissima]|uniref:inner centromere protein-like isoform X2 n=1 Tax=Alosa sapidissima TaxID=34773 RepID=UPI001C083854|nr:inner centromere protein-like isoform X2 [Alosa sapidissima]XP_041961322.1 inner centromere protein-like isoform X2 [Alosa sapidissima]